MYDMYYLCVSCMHDAWHMYALCMLYLLYVHMYICMYPWHMYVCMYDIHLCIVSIICVYVCMYCIVCLYVISICARILIFFFFLKGYLFIRESNLYCFNSQSDGWRKVGTTILGGGKCQKGLPSFEDISEVAFHRVRNYWQWGALALESLRRQSHCPFKVWIMSNQIIYTTISICEALAWWKRRLTSLPNVLYSSTTQYVP